jgi:hypothetical protein
VFVLFKSLPALTLPVDGPGRGERSCPACNVALAVRRMDQVDVEICPRCAHVWLDAGEYDPVARWFREHPPSDWPFHAVPQVDLGLGASVARTATGGTRKTPARPSPSRSAGRRPPPRPEPTGPGGPPAARNDAITRLIDSVEQYLDKRVEE